MVRVPIDDGAQIPGMLINDQDPATRHQAALDLAQERSSIGKVVKDVEHQNRAQALRFKRHVCCVDYLVKVNMGNDVRCQHVRQVFARETRGRA